MELYKNLQNELGKSKQEISKFTINAPLKYKTYQIPKRNGGHRTIAHPSRELKSYQYVLIGVLQNLLPVSSACMAYVKGKGIKKNAYAHKNSRYLLKMDLQEFFHSIRPTILFNELKEHDVSFSKDDEYLLKNLLFWKQHKKSRKENSLSIGAPSSPLVSNFILYRFDLEIDSLCKKNNIKYTRYADDLTFSTNKRDILFSIPNTIRETLTSFFDGAITINERKTVFTSKAHNRHITGVTINNEGQLSIGRERKRYISSLLHKYKLGILPIDELRHLQGLISFANDIEPSFIYRLSKKYGKDTIRLLKQSTKESFKENVD